MIEAFFRGIVLAFGLVIPLGPQNTFIFNQAALQQRLVSALPVLLLAALIDGLLIVSAVLGMNCLLEIAWLKQVVEITGAAFLLYMGYKLLKSSGGASGGAVKISLANQLMFTLSVSLFNPHAILDTFIVIGAVSAEFTGAHKHLFTWGCILTDIVWFTLLTLSGFYLKHLKHAQTITKWINYASVCIMWYIGADLFIDFYKNLFT